MIVVVGSISYLGRRHWRACILGYRSYTWLPYPAHRPHSSGPYNGLWKTLTLRWRHNGHDRIANHQPHDCLLNRLFRRKSKKTLAFVRGIHRGPVNSPHKWPVTRKICPFDDVIMHLKKGATLAAIVETNILTPCHPIQVAAILAAVVFHV